MKTPEELKEEIRTAYAQLHSWEKSRAKFMQSNAIEFFHRPNPAQKQLLEAWDRPELKVFTLTGANRIGKGILTNALLPTPKGMRCAGDLRVGDELFSGNGKRTKIVGVFPQGSRPCFKLIFDTGQTAICDDQHLWKVKGIECRGRKRPWRVVETKDLRPKLRFPLPQAVDLPASPVPLHPYLLGLLLGDGSLHCSVEFTAAIRELQLNVLSSEKFIPEIYKWNSIENRRALLAGLLDTDGYISKKGTIQYYTVSEKLSHDVVWLIQSLGGKVWTTKKETGFQPCFVLTCYLPFNPFWLKRKAERFNWNRQRDVDLILNRIEAVPASETICFKVDSEDETFLLDQWVVTHNTTIGTIIALATLFGKWPWNEKLIPGLKQNYPRKVRYVGQAWETHIKDVVEPAFRKWWPSKRPVEKKKNNQGIDYYWIDNETQSSVEIMSNNQASDVFEGWEGDLVVYDEPPRREIRVACARGLVDRRGRELFVATLLKEAWLHREVIKALTEEGLPDPTYFHVEADISVNIGYGLTREGVDQFAKTLKPEEESARLMGKPSYLSSLVCPQFARKTHIIEPFAIPLNWIIDIGIDFHPAKPWAVQMMGTAPTNFKYICGEIEKHGTPEFIGDEIIRWLRERGISRVADVIIDPLSKGDSNNPQTIYDRLSNHLSSYGIPLSIASKDKEGGIISLNSLLWTDNQMPALLFFRNCPKSITQLEDWLFDPETLKPAKEDDDFCETLYRLVLLNREWFPPELCDVSSQPDVIL